MTPPVIVRMIRLTQPRNEHSITHPPAGRPALRRWRRSCRLLFGQAVAPLAHHVLPLGALAGELAAIISSPVAHAVPRCRGGIATRLEARMPMDQRPGQDHESVWSEPVVPYTFPSPRMCLRTVC